MDPNSSLNMILAAIAAGKWDEVADAACEGLQSWIEKGGFLPDSLLVIAGDLEDEAHELFSEFPESFDGEDDETYFEYRLYIRPDGTLDLNTGDPCFDSDHRGYCGAGTIARHDREGDIALSVSDAFFQAVETYVECRPELKAE